MNLNKKVVLYRYHLATIKVCFFYALLFDDCFLDDNSTFLYGKILS